MNDSKEGGIEQKLLNELRRLHGALSVPPRTVDMGRHGRFSPALYADRFGSWEEALESAGIEGEPCRPPDGVVVEEVERGEAEEDDEEDTQDDVEEPSDERLEIIRRCDERVEGTPTPDDL
ncbi:MAG: homing endonuclease associated repeat-containing protein, partial [Halobacteria archaeon]